MNIAKEKLAMMIDHSMVKADATEELVKKVCEEAKQYSFGAVCILPSYVPRAVELLKKSDVRLCVGIAFPFGAATTETKVFEAKEAIRKGADDIDMVMNIGRFKSKDYDFIKKDIASVVKIVKEEKVKENITLKVIIETGYLIDEEVINASKLIEDAGADFVKTCTGFGPRGTTIKDVRLIRGTVSGKMGVKVAGGIRTFEDALKMIEAGANRIGTSHSVEIIEGWHD